MKRKHKRPFVIIPLVLAMLTPSGLQAEESLFSPEIADSSLVEKIFAFIESNREKIIEEWIFLTEIPAPSGHEEKRAEYIQEQFKKIGLDRVYTDASGNVVGIWRGSDRGKKIIFSAHMDTIFQGVWEIQVKQEGNILKAPGIGDDTASLINLLWTLRALKTAGFEPVHTYYFIGSVGEEIGFVGLEEFLEASQEKFDLLIALDGDLGKVHYGALGFGGGTIVFSGPGAHTMQSRGVPNPILAAAKAVDRISRIQLPFTPIEQWTILNIGMIQGGKVRNAVPHEASITVDLRSADQQELEKTQTELKRICYEAASEVGVDVKIDLNDEAKASQIPGAKDSFLVRTAVDILRYLEVRDLEVDPLGSTEANLGVERDILSINLGRTYGRYKHSLREEAEIDGLFQAMKSIVLLICALN